MSREITITLVVIVAAVVVGAVVTLLGRRAIRRLVDTGEGRVSEERQRLATLWSVGQRVLWVLLFVIAVWTVALVWEIPSTPFVAVGSAVGVALGFGAQSLVKDVLAGFTMISEDQFHVGDVVSIAGVSGVVEDVRLRVTVLRDLDGVVHYVPNGIIEVTSNYTQEFSRVVVDIGVAYDADIDEVIGVLEDELGRLEQSEEWGSAMAEPPTVLGVDAFGDSSVTVRVVLTSVPERRWDLKREALRRIKKRFDAEGIEIPFPQRTVWQRPTP